MPESNTVKSLKELPDLLNRHQQNSPDDIEAKFRLAFQMIAEIHEIICKGRAETAGGYRKPFKHLIPGLMLPGQAYIPENLFKPLLDRGVETKLEGVNSAMIQLATEGKLTRIRSGIYRLPEPGDLVNDEAENQ